MCLLPIFFSLAFTGQSFKCEQKLVFTAQVRDTPFLRLHKKSGLYISVLWFNSNNASLYCPPLTELETPILYHVQNVTLYFLLMHFSTFPLYIFIGVPGNVEML